ncbi:endonuclease [Pantoea allii]|nr:endonuclease [Pantoea allii]
MKNKIFLSYYFYTAFFSCSGTDLQAGFSPGGTAQELIIDFIRSATGSADVAADEFTSEPVAEALVQLSRRGVPVRVVADEKKSHDRWSLVNELACSGIQVRTDAQYSIMHNKFIVTGNNGVQTGSFNYTSSAEKRNAENSLVVRDSLSVSKQYQD